MRQVLALCDYPQLMDSELCSQLFPADAVARAQEYLANMPGGSTGAYTESKGAAICRQHVATGIQARDGHPCDPDDLWLTDGASPSVHMLMNTLVAGEEDAILCPIPQYPLYSAAITLHGEWGAAGAARGGWGAAAMGHGRLPGQGWHGCLFFSAGWVGGGGCCGGSLW